MTTAGSEPSFTFSDAAPYLSELGHPHRLEIFSYLVKANETGATVGEIRAHLGIPKSTLSHHLSQLAAIGLVRQSREGRSIRCRIDEMKVRLVRRFVDQCCDGLLPLSEPSKGS